MAKAGKKKSLQYGDAEDAAKKAASGFTSKSIKLPEGVSFFPMKDEKAYRLRFAPYLVGEHNPEQPAGSLWYARKYWAHARIGAGEDGRGDTYICARLSADKKCAICDHITKLRQNPNTAQELLDDLKPKQRQLFIVRDQDDKGKGWRILDLSYHALGKQLEAKIKGAAAAAGIDDDDMVAPTYAAKKFFHLDGGAILSILMEDPKLKFKFLQAKSIEVTPTKEVLPEDLIDTLPCLDDCLVIPDYKKLEKILLQGDAVGDDEDEEDDGPSANADDEEPEEEEEPADEEEEEAEEVTGGGNNIRSKRPAFKIGQKVRFNDGRGKTMVGKITKINEKNGVALVDYGGKQPAGVDLDEMEPVTDKKEKPAAPAKKGKVLPKNDDLDDDESDDDLPDDDDDEPVEDDDDLPDPDEEEEADEDDFETEDEEEDEEPAPAKKGKVKPPAKPAKVSKSRAFHEEPDEDDDFDLPDDDDDEPAPKPVKKKGKK